MGNGMMNNMTTKPRILVVRVSCSSKERFKGYNQGPPEYASTSYGEISE